MKAWRFSSDAIPVNERAGAWGEALGKVGMSAHAVQETDFFGGLASLSSPQGIEFVRLSSSPQTLVCAAPAGGDGVWLAHVLEGRMSLDDGSRVQELVAQDCVYGVVSPDARLTATSTFRALIVHIPRSAFYPRLMAPMPTNAVYLSGRAGLGHVLAGMLGAVWDALEDMSYDQIRPIEMALPEFLVSGLFRQSDTRALGGAAGVRAALLHRICQSIEQRLADPDLSLGEIAEEHGISPRYLQKLFEGVGQSFGRYVRYRRLERARLDIESPIHAQLSISDICFRWGFNDAAYFSRAFRDQYGISPREYRKKPTQQAQEGPWLINRGRPANAPQEGAQGRAAGVGHEGAEPQGEAAFLNTELDEELVSSLTGSVAELEDEPAEADDDLAAFDGGAGGGGGLDRGLQGPAFGAPVDVAWVDDDDEHHDAQHHYLPVNDKTVHWGYFSRFLPPVIEVESGDFITVETLTQHAYDDYDRMIKDDPGAESVFHWTKEHKAVDRRGAGPLDASTYGRGAGEGFGVHICTGPIGIKGAKPGDVVELRILDIIPRPAQSKEYQGRTFGSNAATWWGLHYNELISPPAPREVVTVYEVDSRRGRPCAHAVYNFRWTPQTDPFGVVHPCIDYPGVPVDHSSIEHNYEVLKNVEIPLRPHFGVIGLAPEHWGIVDSVPPAYFGGNIDNWRLGAGSRIYLPVAVQGGLLSIGDPHASQGDSELCGTAIECSLTGVFQVILHRKSELEGKVFDLDYPLIETADEWVVLGFSHPNYLKELGRNAQSDIYQQSSVDPAMRDAFRKARRFLMTAKGLTEDEAISLLSVAVDFGITQVVDGNWGVHAVIRKDMFTD